MAKVEGGNPTHTEIKQDTKVTVAGRNPFAHHGYVNISVYHASTLLYPGAEDFVGRHHTGDASDTRGHYFYGRRGTPTSEALEQAIPYDVTASRTATRATPGGPTIRFHVGLEDPGDLIADLERGFAALAAARLQP